MLQVAKAHRLLTKAVAGSLYQLIASWKAMKTQHWTWPANLRTFSWPCKQLSNKD